jgi:8-oxo-dGTP pyrophosphatase MutT (NUDIX family)
MDSGPADVAELVAAIDPFDSAERAHQADALAWLARTQDIYRRAKPATPPRHLVSYAVLADPGPAVRHGWSVFLVDHLLAGLWLPAGGHVEPFEDPCVTACREAMEELGIEADLSIAGGRPVFLTATRTRPSALDHGHTDVSLWYLLAGSAALPITLDRREFASGRWWTPAKLESADQGLFDPHMSRFMAKVRAKFG